MAGPGPGQLNMTDLPGFDGSKELDLVAENARDEAYRAEALEVAMAVASQERKVRINNHDRSLPEHILDFSKEQRLPYSLVKRRTEEITTHILALFPTEEDRQKLLDGMKERQLKISLRFNEPEIDRIADLPHPEWNADYAALEKEREETLATIKYLEGVEVSIKKDAELQSKRKTDLIQSFESESHLYSFEGIISEGSLASVLSDMTDKIEFWTMHDLKKPRTPAEKTRVLEGFKDQIQRHYSAEELKLLVSALEEHGRGREADLLKQFI